MKRSPPEYFQDAEQARSYAQSSAKRSINIAREVFVKWLQQQGFSEGRILEVGCGSGEVAIELAIQFPKAKVTGLDLSEPMLEMARASAENAGLSDRVLFKKGDTQSMPFEDKSFDAIVSLNTFHVVKDPVLMVNEIERVLAPDGCLMVTDIRRSWLGLFMPILKTAYTSTEAREVLSRSRLRRYEFLQGRFTFVVRCRCAR